MGFLTSFLTILLVLMEFAVVTARCLKIVFWSLYYSVASAPRKSVKDKVVLITGAGHGVGRELALRFGRLGAKVVLLDINKENNESVAYEVKAEEHFAYSYPCDVSNELEVKEMAKRIRTEVGDVSILINNAAVVNCQPMLDLNPRQVRRTLDVNLLAHFWLIREFLPSMMDRQEGHIVAVSSIAGMIGTGYLTDYCASKFAVRGLMHALEEELYTLKQLDAIKLTTICPMAINTGMFKEPLSRFPFLAPILETKEVAQRIVDAVLWEEKEIVIPHHLLILHKFMMWFPPEAMKLVQRFMGCAVKPH